MKNRVAPAELQLYVDLYPRGAFVDLVNARMAALQSAVATGAPFTPAIVDPGTGRLTIRDEYTGNSTVIDVHATAKTAESTLYSSGDVIASTGQVLAVRFGQYVGKAKRGALWTLPLRSGAHGSAAVQIEGEAEEAEFDWRVVERATATGRLEVQMRLPVANYPICQRSGLWNAQYKDDAPLPITSKLAVQTNVLGCAMRDRVATEWQPRPRD